MPAVIVVQHVPCETPGTIVDALQSTGVAARYIRTFQGDPVPPKMGDAVGLVVMGGPMGVYEQELYPFLRDEMRLMEDALHREKPILGVCLGSQLLAATLGARVARSRQKEIGWHPIRLAPAAAHDPLWKGCPPSFMAYHWHGDVFPLPHGAVALASSPLTEYQAFRYGPNAYGFLFHMEVTRQIIEEMIATFWNELQEEGLDGHQLLAASDTHLPSLERIGGNVFRRWAGLARPESI